MNENAPDFDCFVDAIVETIESYPKPMVQIMDMKRLSEVLRAKSLFSQIFFDLNCDYDIKLNLNADMGYACIDVEIDDITIHNCNIKLFFEAIKAASNFEIYPLLNGKLRFSLMYYKLFIVLA
jgi:hypothetical protein